MVYEWYNVASSGKGELASKDSNDENERWYYADKDGKLKSGEIAKINGKYYGFYPSQESDKIDETTKAARAFAGLNRLKVVSGKVDTVYDDVVDADELDDLLDNGKSSDAPKGDADYSYVNKDNETVRVWIMDDPTNTYLVNTSGNIQKSKTSGVKDGNDCYYYVDSDRHVILYTDNKVLKTKDNSDITVNGNSLSELVSGLKAAGVDIK